MAALRREQISRRGSKGRNESEQAKNESKQEKEKHRSSHYLRKENKGKYRDFLAKKKMESRVFENKQRNQMPKT